MTMSINAPGSESDPIVEMNTTPLIDVMLVLLIMFIITMPLMTHSISLGIQGGTAKTLPPVVNVDIEFDGTVIWNGVAVADLEQLEGYFRVEAARPVQPDLQVRPDRRADYDTVAKVLALAQRNGMKHIGIGAYGQAD